MDLIPGTFYSMDTDPTWAPDGRRFVTVRDTSATHMEGRNLRPNQALMLFERSDVRNGRMVFLADHGDYAADYGLQRKGVGLPECLVRIPFMVRSHSSTLRMFRTDIRPSGSSSACRTTR